MQMHDNMKNRFNHNLSLRSSNGKTDNETDNGSESV